MPYKRKDGYIDLYKPNHANARKNGKIFEHRYVMSEYLGRPLKDTETVHHRNGVKDDNRLINLELFETRHPGGIRKEDFYRIGLDIVKDQVLRVMLIVLICLIILNIFI